MKPKAYLETSFVSYVTAWMSRDLIVAGHQQVTQAWWRQRRGDFDLYISQFVLLEAGGGDPGAAAERLQVLKDIPSLETTPEAQAFARKLMVELTLPRAAAVDALHIALAAVHQIDYLLTWNCRHLANAVLRKQIDSLCRAAGHRPPVICTPEELLGE